MKYLIAKRPPAVLLFVIAFLLSSARAMAGTNGGGGVSVNRKVNIAALFIEKN